MKYQKLEPFAAFGAGFLVCFILLFPLITIVTKSLFAGLKWGFVITLATCGIAGLGSLLKKGIEKFQKHKVQFEGEWVVRPRSMETRGAVVSAICELVFIGLVIAAAYGVNGAGKAAAILLLGFITSFFTYAIVSVYLAPDIHEPNSIDDKDRMSYLFLVLFMHTTIMAIVVFLILFFR